MCYVCWDIFEQLIASAISLSLPLWINILKAWRFSRSHRGLAEWPPLQCEAGTSALWSWGREGVQQTEASPRSGLCGWSWPSLAWAPSLNSSHTPPSYCCCQPLWTCMQTQLLKLFHIIEIKQKSNRLFVALNYLALFVSGHMQKGVWRIVWRDGFAWSAWLLYICTSEQKQVNL